MPDIAHGVSKQDQLDLLGAIVTHFGDCTCQSFHLINGQKTWLNVCPAHQFLREQDHSVSRVQRLAFARAMRSKWQHDEQGRSDEDPIDRMRRELGW